MISESATTLFSLNISNSTGAASSSESTRHLWKLFRSFFLVNKSCGTSKSTRHLRKVFWWWFPSRHRLRFLWLFLSQQGLRALPNPRVTFGSCFVHFFVVNKGCGASKSMRHLWKVFQWRFPSGHRLRFPWLFLSQQAPVSASKSTYHLWKVFRRWFPRWHQLRFRWLFLSQQGL